MNKTNNSSCQTTDKANDKQKKIIIVGNGGRNSVSDNIFRTVINKEVKNVEYYFIWNIKNPIVSFIQKKYYSRKLNLYKKLPFFKRFFAKYNAFEQIKSKEKNAIIIINLASQYSNLTTKEELIGLKKLGFILVLFCIDSIDSPQMNNGEIVSWFNIFDLVISDSPYDSAKYNLFYHMDPYPWKKDEVTNASVENDLYFLGRGKDRTELCCNIINYLNQEGIKCDFTIVDLESRKKKTNKLILPPGIENINYIYEKVQYDSILKGINRSNCILELISYGNGASLRYFEAIVFNKKLLTNNKEAFKLPFFNSDYMKIIDSPKDIDIEWLKSKDNVDYSYDGSFSVDSFIQDIRKELRKKGF